MALVTEKDGTETTGGIAAIRDAFVNAGEKKLSCSHATMGYHASGDQSQVLRFVGMWNADGKPFDVTETVPPGAPLAPHARAAARKLIDPQ